MEQKTDTKKPAARDFDYKDVELLKKFLNPHGRIQSRRITHLPAANQRKLAMAVKHARFMGLLPYVIK